MKTAFTLVELLLALAILSVLASIGFTGYGNLRTKTHDLECAARLRGLGQAVLLYTANNGGHFPQSSHSGSSWALALAPYLGEPELANPLDYRKRTVFSCPLSTTAAASPQLRWSYGLNVFFELNPELRYTPAGLPILGSRDSYPGSPATWHRLSDIPVPPKTVLFAESTHPLADHFMAHQWSSAAAAQSVVAARRHDNKANYAFVDGHIETLSIEKTFAPEAGVNRWNPSLAR